MRSQVIVKWSDIDSYRFDLEVVQPMPHEQARVWLDEQFTAFQCEPIRLTGKVLTADKLLAVADAAGARAFGPEGDPAWAARLAAAACAATGRPVVRLDIVEGRASF